MKRTSLSSDLGNLFLYGIYFYGIVCLGLFVHAIVDFKLSNLIGAVIISTFYYLAFFRKVRRIQSVTFDENYFYTKKGDKIEFLDIEKIEDSKIICNIDGVKKVIYTNPFYPGKNHKLFYKYFITNKV